MIELTCEACGESFSVKPSRLKRSAKVRFCSMSCRRDTQYTGRFLRSDGYVAIRTGSSYVLEHRYLMEQHLGRSLQTSEHVHHRNGVKSDNRISNLEVMQAGKHSSLHHPGVDLETWSDTGCLFCGEVFLRRDCQTRMHPNTFCSRKCYVAGKRAGLTP